MGIVQHPFSFRHLGDIFELGKPLEWGRTWICMLFGVLMAYYVYGRGLDTAGIFLGALSVTALWSGLYALNDIADRYADAMSAVRKYRPIPSGRVSVPEAAGFTVLFLAAAFVFAAPLGNPVLYASLLVMLANQVLYTFEPVRLKSHVFLDLVSGTLINPFFRYLAGLSLLVPGNILFSSPFPVLPVIIVTGIQFSGYVLSRLYFRTHQQELSMGNTVARYPERWIRAVSTGMIAAALAAAGLLFINGVTGRNPWLGFLPPQYLLPLVLVLALIPLVKDSVKDPRGTDMLGQVRILYLYIVPPGILLTALLLFFWP
jgi:4-hydroxybenzoate polyprenyltransferase